MSIATEAEPLISRNPATGAEFARREATPVAEVTAAIGRARAAQARWQSTSWPERRAVLRRAWAAMSAEADAWAEAITFEAGKPRIEARIEVVSTLDALRWLVKRGGRALADKRLWPSWQVFMGLKVARLRWVPYGVVGKLGTWNYPLFLNAPAIAAALAAGNAVVWKPSEYASELGVRIQAWADAAGFPDGLVATVFGGPDVGRALIGGAIDKAMFTGGVEGGRKVLEALARRGVPAVVELSGFDPAIVLPDAPREATASALAWSSFVGCGQTCVAVKRVYVVGEATPWAEDIAERAKALRVGDPSGDEVDVGPMISRSARGRFDKMVQEAVHAGANVLAGGALPDEDTPGAFYPPTVLLAKTARPEAALAGSFGPVVIVRGVATVEAAIAAANESPYGLAASVWGRDRASARAVANRLRAGTVGINEAVTPTAHVAAPFGGEGASGFGRVHGAIGLREFAQPRGMHERGPGGFRPQLFPYHGRRLSALLKLYRRLFHSPR
jgi:acyl-CoA reductase-like NAD-dependent aldehyde dehydrogenase